MRNSTEKDTYCSFIGFILQKFEISKNVGATEYLCSQPTTIENSVQGNDLSQSPRQGPWRQSLNQHLKEKSVASS